MDNFQEKRELAKAFLAAIKEQKLTGREFLSLIGNTKISNSAYNEIKSNPQLTYSRLVEIFTESPLQKEDFARILRAARSYRSNNPLAQPADTDRSRQEEILKQAVSKAEQRLETQRKLEKFRQTAVIEPIKSTAKESYADAREEPRLVDEYPLYQRRAESDAGRTLHKRLSAELTEETVQPVTQSDEDSYYAKYVSRHQEENEQDDNAYGYQFTSELGYGYDDSDYDQDDEYDNEKYDERYDEEHETEHYDEEYLDDETNKSRIILSAGLAVVLVILSFVLRYINTGSWLVETSDIAVYDAPVDYKELAGRLYGASTEHDEYLAPDALYTLLPAQKEASPMMCANDNYIFKILEGKLHVIETHKGEMQNRAVIRTDGEFAEIFINNGRLFVVENTESVLSYSDSDPIGNGTEKDENGEPIYFEAKDALTHPTTTVTIFDAESFSKKPLNIITVDGKLQDIVKHDSDVYIFTDYMVKNAAAHNDNNAFVPAYEVMDEERRFVQLENISLPEQKLAYANYTVIAKVAADNNVLVKAAIGGYQNRSVIHDNKLFILQNEPDASRIAVYEAENGNFQLIQHLRQDGTVAALDYRQNILRVITQKGEGYRLSIFKEEMVFTDDTTQSPQFGSLSTVENIAIGATLTDILFDDSFVYLIGETMYVFDTHLPEEPTAVDSGFGGVYTNDGYVWGDNYRLTLEETAHGLKLVMSEMKDGVTTKLHELEITEESIMGGGQNCMLKSYALTDPHSIYYSATNSLIVLPINYFNGISNIEKFVLLYYNDASGFIEYGELVYYDWNKHEYSAICVGEYVYTFWDDTAVSADLSTLMVKEMRNIDGSSIIPEKPPEMEADSGIELDAA